MKSKGGGKGKGHRSKPPQHSKDTMKKFEEQLQRPVDIRDLASRYGLDYEKMEKVVEKEDEVGEDKQATREARRNISVLKGIQRYLQTARAAMKIQGNRVHMVLHRLPGSLLTVEEKRCEALNRSGHRLVHNYAKLLGNTIYRCPVPGCGAATINSASIARSTPVHFRAFHRDLDIIFVIKIELRNGWDFIQVPEQEYGAKRRTQHEEPDTQQQEEGWEEKKERTCSELQPYQGKTSLQSDKTSRSTHNRPEMPAAGANVQAQASQGMESVTPHRLSAEAAASKGVYKIAPGPRGSGIQAVDHHQKGPGNKPYGDKGSKTKAEFEQHILERTG